ncbi:ATP-binding protein [Micromonospora sp. NPDC005252]|uniref:ATP-binding protein n=1 Tax=Micromonospora sp. NPDC005252 TaxID=3364228 RepID=UPI0036A46ED7
MDKRPISYEEALALVERDESPFWDCKSAKSGGSAIQKIGAALANTDGGDFVVGIEDRAKGVGIDRWQGFSVIEDATPVLEALSRDVSPPVPYSVEFLVVQGYESSGMVCLIQVAKSSSVHYAADKKVYIRRGASSVAISGNAVTDLSLSKGARSYEDQLLEDYFLDDLVEEPEIDTFLQGYSPATSAASLVRSRRLIDRQSGRARVCAAILYAEIPSAVVPKRCAVKVARYNTKEQEPLRVHLVDVPKTIEGPARVLIEETLKEVSKLIESVSTLTPDGKLEPLRYPPEVLKEIVVNAVIHRDYNISDDIRVYVFNNRVEVRSPGGLPGHMTLDNLFSDERASRNPKIVQLLNKYPDPPNKDIGEGLRTVLNKMKEARLQPPKFSVVNNQFVVEIGHTPLARPQEIVLEYLEAHEEITNAIGRELTGITSENSMKDVFYSLRQSGILEMVPGKKGSRSAWRKMINLEEPAAIEIEGLASLVEPEADLPASGEEARRDESTETPTAFRVLANSYGRAKKKFNHRDGRQGRNDPCGCGSGVKFKRCCGRLN